MPLETITLPAASVVLGQFAFGSLRSLGGGRLDKFLESWAANVERVGQRAAKAGELPANHHLRNAGVEALSNAVRPLQSTLLRADFPDGNIPLIRRGESIAEWLRAL